MIWNAPDQADALWYAIKLLRTTPREKWRAEIATAPEQHQKAMTDYLTALVKAERVASAAKERLEKERILQASAGQQRARTR